MGCLSNCNRDKNSNNNNNLLQSDESQMYYQNYTLNNNNNLTVTEPTQKINLLISLSNIEPAIYSVQVLLTDDILQTSYVIGRTNTKEAKEHNKETNNITFDTTIVLDYYFEKEQKLRFSIFKLNQKITEEIVLNTNVASIMGAKNQRLSLCFKDQSSQSSQSSLSPLSSLIIKGETIKNNSYIFSMELLIDCSLVNISNCMPFFILKRKVDKLQSESKDKVNDKNTYVKKDMTVNKEVTKEVTNKNDNLVNGSGKGIDITSDMSKLDNSNWIAFYKSEVSNMKDLTLLAYNKFKVATIPIYVITNENDFNKAEVTIEVHDNRNRKLLGTSNISMEKLLLTDTCFNENSNYGVYTIKTRCIVEKIYNFLDYLRGGLDISMIVGIDFTSSNGDPKNPNSLHYISNNNNENQYERAIKACGSIVSFYDSDQLFPVFGYGGILPNDNGVNHCFNVNFNKTSPEVQGIDGILNAYRNALQTVKLYGPTYFAPLISKAIDICNNMRECHMYQILMIFTDGNINDMQETIDELVKASYLPLSVVIIGIGNGIDFISSRVFLLNI